jgi:thiol:disulfide interchange protein DsbD
MALVLFGVGLNLSGVFGFGGSVGLGQSLAGRQGLAGSFCSGMLAVLVATPCTAPFMSVALTAGLAGSTMVTLGVFAALGAGLACPYVLLAFVPRMTCALLPRPGAWMDVLRQGLAFPMYGGAIWLAWVLSIESGPPGVLALLIAAGMVGMAGWLLGLAQSGTGGRIGRGLAAVCVVAALIPIAGLTVAEGVPTLAGGTPAAGGAEAFSAARLAELRAAGRPVFVNMTAAWCVSCLVNERVALSRAPVQAAFARGGVVYLKGDWTRQDPAITAYLRANGAEGVPLYVFYPAGNKPAVILPQILTPSVVLEAIGAG